MMEYGPLLKKLISFSGMKMSAVAELLSYDVSYISKWCNQSKLPAARTAGDVNRSLSDAFSREIAENGDEERFYLVFSAPKQGDLEQTIYKLLKSAFRQSAQKGPSAAPAAASSGSCRILTQTADIYQFFHQEFFEILSSSEETPELLCTMDVCRFLDSGSPEPLMFPSPAREVKAKFAINPTRLFSDSRKYLKSLYSFLNLYNNMSFEIYDDSLMSAMNTIVIKDRMAVICSLDQYSRISTAVVIRSPEKVNQIYLKLLPIFRHSSLMLHAAKADELTQNGYRTDFYTKQNFQIFTARGFEFLLPVDCFDSIMQAAMMQDASGYEARMTAKMQITWDESFEKSTMDFFITKSSLLKYLEDGEIVFLDVVYRMTVPERKKHIQKVLDVTAKNPNIRFYVIDDDLLPDMQHLFGASLYSNRKKIFLKNLWNLHDDSDAKFYCIDSDTLIKEIVHFFDETRNSQYCFPYDAEGLRKFAERYGSLINRMLDLNERG